MALIAILDKESLIKSAENLTVKIAVHQPEGLQYTTLEHVILNHL